MVIREEIKSRDIVTSWHETEKHWKFDSNVTTKRKVFFLSHKSPYSAVLTSVSLAKSQTSAHTVKDHEYRASASCWVPVYSTVFVASIHKKVARLSLTWVASHAMKWYNNNNNHMSPTYFFSISSRLDASSFSLSSCRRCLICRSYSSHFWPNCDSRSLILTQNINSVLSANMNSTALHYDWLIELSIAGEGVCLALQHRHIYQVNASWRLTLTTHYCLCLRFVTHDYVHIINFLLIIISVSHHRPKLS